MDFWKFLPQSLYLLCVATFAAANPSPRTTTVAPSPRSTAYSNSSSAASSSSGFTGTPICSPGYDCPATCSPGYTTNFQSCGYGAPAVAIIYWYPTTYTVTAATVFYNSSNGTATSYTVTSNLTSYYNSLGSALVPAPLTQDCGPYECIYSLDVATGSTWELTVTEYESGSTSLSSTPLTVGTNYLDILIVNAGDPPTPDEPEAPGFEVFYECIDSEEGYTYSTNWSPLTDSAGNDLSYEIVIPVPSSDTIWNNPNMTTLPLDNNFGMPAYVNSAVHSLFPYLPYCNGSGEGFPSPKVVVSQLTATVGTPPSTTTTPQPANNGGTTTTPTQTGSGPGATGGSGGGSGGNQGSGSSGNQGSGSSGNEGSGSSGNQGSGSSGNQGSGSSGSSGNQGSGSGSSGSGSGNSGSGSGNGGSGNSGSNAGSGSGFGSSGQATFTVGGQTFTATSGVVSIAGTTLSAGSGAATTGNQVVSVNSVGVVVSPVSSAVGAYVASGVGATAAAQAGGATTYTFGGSGSGSITAASATTISGAIVMVGGQVYTENPGGSLIFTFTGSNGAVTTTTLSAGGGAATISGTVVSIGPSGVVIGGSTASYSAIATSTKYSGPMATGGAAHMKDSMRSVRIYSSILGLFVGALALL